VLYLERRDNAASISLVTMAGLGLAIMDVFKLPGSPYWTNQPNAGLVLAAVAVYLVWLATYASVPDEVKAGMGADSHTEGRTLMPVKHTHIGGQAVLEGVMMSGRHNWAVAIRKPDGDIHVEEHGLRTAVSKHPKLGKPIIRGVVGLYESLVLAMKAFAISAEYAGETEEEKLSSKEIALSMTLGVGPRDPALHRAARDPHQLHGRAGYRAALHLERGRRHVARRGVLRLHLGDQPRSRTSSACSRTTAPSTRRSTPTSGAPTRCRDHPALPDDARAVRDLVPADGDGHRHPCVLAHPREGHHRPGSAPTTGRSRSQSPSAAHPAAAAHRRACVRGHQVGRQGAGQPGRASVVLWPGLQLQR
jgi:hypothetical protein